MADGTKLGDHLRAGKGLLLDFNAGSPLQALASRWDDRITYIASDVKDRLGFNAVLVRPDGIVAWASESAPRQEVVVQAISRWFGEA
jgi:hypothetical protein